MRKLYKYFGGGKKKLCGVSGNKYQEIRYKNKI